MTDTSECQQSLPKHMIDWWVQDNQKEVDLLSLVDLHVLDRCKKNLETKVSWFLPYMKNQSDSSEYEDYL